MVGYNPWVTGSPFRHITFHTFQKNTMGMKHDPFPSHPSRRPGVSKHIRPRITPGISWKLTLHTFQGREIIQNVLTVNLVWDSRGKNCEAPFQSISTESGRWFSMVFLISTVCIPSLFDSSYMGYMWEMPQVMNHKKDRPWSP